MNPSGPSPTPPLALRMLRVIVRVGLAAIITFFVALAFLTVVSSAREVIGFLLGSGDAEKSAPRDAVLLTLAAVMFTGLLSWLGRRLSWRALAMGYAAVAPVLIYLTIDSPTLKRPQTMEEFSPTFPGADASYNVLMRYGTLHEGARNFRGSKLTWVAYDPEKPELWVKFVTEHRAEIEQEWQALAPLRAWWAELNAFDRIGDRKPPRFDGELLAFRPVRELSQRACAIATLQALDGHGDDAITTVLPLLEGARKLQPFARNIVRAMIAIVIERISMQTVSFTLDHATVSPAVRARLAAALAVPGGGEAGARRLLAIEYVLAREHCMANPLGDCIAAVERMPAVRLALNTIGPFVYNPRTTLNLYADLITDEEEIVGRRQLQKLKPRLDKFYEYDARPRFKNFVGAILVQQLNLAYDKVAATYWKVQDDRAALLARVMAP